MRYLTRTNEFNDLSTRVDALFKRDESNCFEYTRICGLISCCNVKFVPTIIPSANATKTAHENEIERLKNVVTVKNKSNRNYQE